MKRRRNTKSFMVHENLIFPKKYNGCFVSGNHTNRPFSLTSLTITLTYISITYMSLCFSLNYRLGDLFLVL